MRRVADEFCAAPSLRVIVREAGTQEREKRARQVPILVVP